MQQEDDLDDITFAHNDRPSETLRAVDHLRTQVERMLDHGSLEPEERKKGRIAHGALTTLGEMLQSRRDAEAIDNLDFELLSEMLQGVNDLAGDIMGETEDVSGTIRDMGWPETNPYEVAERSGLEATQQAQTVADLEAQILLDEIEESTAIEDEEDDEDDEANH